MTFTFYWLINSFMYRNFAGEAALPKHNVITITEADSF